MHLDEATQILKNAVYFVEYTSMYSALSDFYRYLKIKVPKPLQKTTLINIQAYH